jgi:hypothetical protein
MIVSTPIPDWQDPAAYHWCHDLDRAGFAWEFLRRHSGYHGTATVGPASLPPVTSYVEILPAASLVAQPWGLSFRRE